MLTTISKAAAEKAAAEKADAYVWELSPQERQIIANIGKEQTYETIKLF